MSDRYMYLSFSENDDVVKHSKEIRRRLLQRGNNCAAVGVAPLLQALGNIKRCGRVQTVRELI